MQNCNSLHSQKSLKRRKVKHMCYSILNWKRQWSNVNYIETQSNQWFLLKAIVIGILKIIYNSLHMWNGREITGPRHKSKHLSKSVSSSLHFMFYGPMESLTNITWSLTFLQDLNKFVQRWHNLWNLPTN